jgi:hypothetical protein
MATRLNSPRRTTLSRKAYVVRGTEIGLPRGGFLPLLPQRSVFGALGALGQRREHHLRRQPA